MSEEVATEILARQKGGQERKSRLVSTARPIEMMLELTGQTPKWFSGKSVLNAGAGKLHWGLDLTRKYGIIAKRFENFDIKYLDNLAWRQTLGKALLAETGGDVKKGLPYEDGEFDLVWCSVAPSNY